ncbi:M48 family metallopeptidase [Labilibacter sediminis]|nr:M48 family metallopeptidase [Labilibacter sediminis]
MNYDVNPKEGFYFGIKLIVSIAAYGLLAAFLSMGINTENSPAITVAIFYAVIIGIALIFRMGILVGYLKGNAIKITDKQFPDIYKIVAKQSEKLGLRKIPDVYILQAGGLLNAFATRFMGRNYVVIYSDILEEAYENNLESVEFVIGHELGHIKRKHISKQLILFPSIFIPFLNQAYSRACEYTCDNIGAALSPKGVLTGLILLSSGKKLYKKVNVETFAQQNSTETSFWAWFAEKVSTHPKLTKRISRHKNNKAAYVAPVKTEPIIPKYETVDHNQYMP